MSGAHIGDDGTLATLGTGCLEQALFLERMEVVADGGGGPQAHGGADLPDGGGVAVGLRSTASVSYHLQALQAKGLLQDPGAKGRKRAIVTTQRPGQIPVVGVVTAGLPILAVENQEGTMAWEGDPSCFALRVRGDSMINAGILSGDKVVVRPQQTANDGQIVVARIGDEATVKRLRRRNGQVWLLPENDAYEPIDGTEAEIIGLVKAVYREY